MCSKTWRTGDNINKRPHKSQPEPNLQYVSATHLVKNETGLNHVITIPIRHSSAPLPYAHFYLSAVVIVVALLSFHLLILVYYITLVIFA